MTMRKLAALSVAALAAGLVLAAPVRAEDKTFTMKMSTATINDAQHHWMRDYAAMVEKDSGGRIKAEIYPASQLGAIPRQIEGTQFGSIQAYIGPPEFLVGLDERFQVLTASGLVRSLDHAIRITEDAELKKTLYELGKPKGLEGVGLWISAPSSIITRKPAQHLADFKGLKVRVLASAFADEEVKRLGASPVEMTLGDVLPAIQQGALDGAVAQVAVFTTMQYFDAAKYITETGHNYIFSMAFLSTKWLATLPPDLQKVLREDAEKASAETNPWAKDFFLGQKKVWADKQGQLLQLPPEEEATMMKNLSTVGEDLSQSKPALHAAYESFVAAVKRTSK